MQAFLQTTDTVPTLQGVLGRLQHRGSALTHSPHAHRLAEAALSRKGPGGSRHPPAGSPAPRDRPTYLPPEPTPTTGPACTQGHCLQEEAGLREPVPQSWSFKSLAYWDSRWNETLTHLL